MDEHRGTRDQNGAMARPVSVPWVCNQSGDCCRAVGQVTMTHAERALLEKQYTLATRVLEWSPDPDPNFTRLTAAPCPFLSDQNTCLVHETRPYNCRRFMCGRVDISRESFEMGGPMGCHNLTDRLLTSRRFMEFYRSRDREAMKWGRDHGWGKQTQTKIEVKL